VQRVVIIAISVSTLAAIGCVPPPEVAIVYPPAIDRGHFIAFNHDAGGGSVSVLDRSSTVQAVTLTRSGSGAGQMASVTVAGNMNGGNVVLPSDNMTVDPATTGRRVPSFMGTDSFLEQLASGQSSSLLTYHKIIGGKEYRGYFTTGEIAQRHPSTGTATYNGIVRGTTFGSTTGERDLAGNVTLRAAFESERAAKISGTMTGLTANSLPLGADIVIVEGQSTDSQFGGTLRLVDIGTMTNRGTMSDSRYDGYLFGQDAPNAAGTFQFDAMGVPVLLGIGGTERLQGVGGFHASR
jgi:hypothetical protein